MPNHGVFVENRLKAFLQRHDADIRVVAPVPWFPFQNKTFGRYGAWARAPLREHRSGLEIRHPRFFVPPKMGMRFAPAALSRCLRNSARALKEEGWDFDLIDAHYFYPDGAAAAMVAEEFGKPFVVTARGADVNVLPAFAGPRRALLQAASKADAVIAVAGALKKKLIALGVYENKITVLRNGVDLETFRPSDRAAIRKRMGLSGRVLASVGRLTPHKGHDLAIEALQDLPGTTLLIAGEGEARQKLEKRAAQCGVEKRVRFLGAVPHAALKDVYSAADILILASSREGWPNVLLEAMACGTPCIAADVDGVCEVIRRPQAGRLLKAQTAKAVAGAAETVFDNPPCRAATRAYAEGHGWEETADAMAILFASVKQKAETKAQVRHNALPVAATPRRPRLIVTVDTEESFDWRGFDRNQYNVTDTQGLAAFQNACVAESAKPLYFLTYPVMKDEGNASYFRKLVDHQEADFGLHLHSWTTPPYAGENAYSSFQSNLPLETLDAKLRALAGAFTDVFGRPACAHRAGRYGVAPHVYPALASVGVRYDFSPSPGFDFSALGGPDFSTASNRPYMAAGDDWCIAVTPVSGAAALQRTRFFFSQERKQSRTLLLKRRIPMRLSPEGASLDDMKALTRRLLADKTPMLTLTLHSTSLSPGGSPYAANSEDAARIIITTQHYLQWFRETLDGEIVSLAGLGELYESGLSEMGS